MLSKVEMYLKDSKSLAALVLLEAVFIVAVTEPVGPKEYVHSVRLSVCVFVSCVLT